MISQSNDTVSYPPPTLSHRTLRQIRAGYPASFEETLLLDTAASVQIQFDGNNLVPALTTVSP